MLLAAYRGGGRRCTLWCSKPTIPKYAIIRYFLRGLLRLMYILSFYTINALKTQKNGRLLYIVFYSTQYCVLVAQAAHNNTPLRSAIRRKSKFCGVRESLSFLSMCTRSSFPPFPFAPPPFRPLQTSHKCFSPADNTQQKAEHPWQLPL